MAPATWPYLNYGMPTSSAGYGWPPAPVGMPAPAPVAPTLPTVPVPGMAPRNQSGWGGVYPPAAPPSFGSFAGVSVPTPPPVVAPPAPETWDSVLRSGAPEAFGGAMHNFGQGNIGRGIGGALMGAALTPAMIYGEAGGAGRAIGGLVGGALAPVIQGIRNPTEVPTAGGMPVPAAPVAPVAPAAPAFAPGEVVPVPVPRPAGLGTAAEASAVPGAGPRLVPPAPGSAGYWGQGSPLNVPHVSEADAAPRVGPVEIVRRGVSDHGAEFLAATGHAPQGGGAPGGGYGPMTVQEAKILAAMNRPRMTPAETIMSTAGSIYETNMRKQMMEGRANYEKLLATAKTDDERKQAYSKWLTHAAQIQDEFLTRTQKYLGLGVGQAGVLSQAFAPAGGMAEPDLGTGG